MVTKEVSSGTGGLMEGGPSTCHKHNFTTDNVQKWHEHIGGQGHTDAGQKPCILCGKVVFYDSHPTGKNIVCEDCKPLLVHSKQTEGKKK